MAKVERKYFRCDKCKEKFTMDEYNELILDGTEDFYLMILCNKCNDIMSDYYSPEQVDEMFL